MQLVHAEAVSLRLGTDPRPPLRGQTPLQHRLKYLSVSGILNGFDAKQKNR